MSPSATSKYGLLIVSFTKFIENKEPRALAVGASSSWLGSSADSRLLAAACKFEIGKAHLPTYRLRLGG